MARADQLCRIHQRPERICCGPNRPEHGNEGVQASEFAMRPSVQPVCCDEAASQARKRQVGPESWCWKCILVPLRRSKLDHQLAQG